jgi:hypothetical protein
MRAAIYILAIASVFFPARPSHAEESEKTYEGFLILAPEVDTFTPCGSKDSLWLDLPDGTWEPLAKQYRKLVKEAYEGTYAVLIGKPGPKLDCGFCENYPGSFKVVKVLEHRRAKATDCKMPNKPLNPGAPNDGAPVS